MNHNRSVTEIFWRIILVAALLVQYLVMPFSVSAQSADSPTITDYVQQPHESDDMYLERMSAEQPELFQYATMNAVTDALNGNLPEGAELEETIVNHINTAVLQALANPNAANGVPNTDGALAADGAYNWNSPTSINGGTANGAWMMNASPNANPQAFEEAFEKRLDQRINGTSTENEITIDEASSGDEEVVAEPVAPEKAEEVTVNVAQPTAVPPTRERVQEVPVDAMPAVDSEPAADESAARELTASSSVTFTTHTIASGLSGAALKMEVHDVDGDGYRDILLASDEQIAWVRNIGDGTFSAPIIIVTANSIGANGKFTAVGYGDTQDDGVDIVYAWEMNTSPYSQRTVLLTNDGTGTWWTETILETNSSGAHTIGDLDIGKINYTVSGSNEIVYHNSDTQTVGVWSANGASWTETPSLVAVSGATVYSKLSIREVGLDGYNSIVLGSLPVYDGETAAALPTTGDYVFGTDIAEWFPAYQYHGGSPSSFTGIRVMPLDASNIDVRYYPHYSSDYFPDVDVASSGLTIPNTSADGDLAVANLGTDCMPNIIHVTRQDGKLAYWDYNVGIFQYMPVTEAGWSFDTPTILSVGDVDSDGDVDILVLTEGATPQLHLVENNYDPLMAVRPLNQVDTSNPDILKAFEVDVAGYIGGPEHSCHVDETVDSLVGLQKVQFQLTDLAGNLLDETRRVEIAENIVAVEGFAFTDLPTQETYTVDLSDNTSISGLTSTFFRELDFEFTSGFLNTAEPFGIRLVSGVDNSFATLIPYAFQDGTITAVNYGLDEAGIPRFLFDTGQAAFSPSWPLIVGLANEVHAVEALSGGVYAGGVSSVQVYSQYIAGWSNYGAPNGGTVHAVHFMADGTWVIGGTFGVALFGASGWEATDLGGTIYALASDGTTLYAAGEDMGGGAYVKRSVDGGAWETVGAGQLNGTVHALAIFEDTLYAGGAFADHFKRWTGSNWEHPYDPNWGAFSGEVRTLELYQGRLAVGGAFSAYHSEDGATTYGLALWDGQQMQALRGVTGATQQVRALAAQGSYLAVGGDFEQVGGGAEAQNAFDIALWNGAAWQNDFGGVYGADEYVNAVSFPVDPSQAWLGFLWVGGKFGRIGGGGGSNIGVYAPPTVDVGVTLTQPISAEWPTTIPVTITVQNHSAETVTDIEVSDNLPTGFSYSSSDGDCTATAEAVVCSIAELAANASATIHLQLAISEAGTGSVTNSVTVSLLTTVDGNPANNIASAPIELSIDPSITIDLEATVSGPAAVEAGDVATYTVNIANTGVAESTAITATLELPEGSTLISGLDGCSVSFGTYTCIEAGLASGTSVTRTVVVTMDGFGETQFNATVDHADTPFVVYEIDTADNSASAFTFVVAEGRGAVTLGRTVIEANSITADGDNYTASGAIYIGYRNDDNSVTYHLKLTGGTDEVTWNSSASPIVINGNGSFAHLVSDRDLFAGDFTIADVDAPVITPVGDDVHNILTVADFDVVGSVDFVQIDVETGAAEISAELSITPPGVSTTANATVQLFPDGSVTGSIVDLTFEVAGLTITAAEAQIDADGISAATISLTLPDSLGGAGVEVADLTVQANRITIGGVGVTIPLPDITIGDGSTVIITDIAATIGFYAGTWSVRAEGNINLTLPDNDQTLEVSFYLDTTGRLVGTVARIELDVAGAKLVLKDVAVGTDGLFVNTAMLTLPPSMQNIVATVREVAITADGLSIGGASAAIPLPDIPIGRAALIHDLSATLEINSGRSASISFAFALEGAVRIQLPPNEQTVNFTGRIEAGGITGTISGFTLQMAGSELAIGEMTFDNDHFHVDSAELTLPPTLNSTTVTLTDIEINGGGLSIGGGNVSVPIPDIELGQAAGVSLTVTNAALGLVYSNGIMTLGISGTVRIELATDSVEVTGTLTIDWDGRVSGELDAFTLSIAGLTLQVENATLDDGVVHAETLSLAMPEAWGGASVAVYDLRVGGSDGISIGGGRFELPPIKVGSTTMFSLMGEFKREGDGFLITAAGKFSMPNVAADAPGCSGIGVSVTLYYDASRDAIVADVAPLDAQAVTSLGLRNISISAQCRIPITGTGFSITEISGSLTLQNNSTRVELAVAIESDFRAFDVPAVATEPTLGVEGGPGYFQMDFYGAVEIFSIFTAAEIDALMRFGQRHPGDADGIVRATLNVDMVLIRGNAYFAAWSQAGNFHLVGGGSLSIGFDKGQIREKCLPCLPIPPWDMRLTVGTDFGEFHHGSGTTWGLKAYLKLFGFEIGFYINTAGDWRFGSVSSYHTITPPSLQRVRELDVGLRTGQLSRAALSAEDQALLNTHRVVENTIETEFEVTQTSDVMVNFGRATADTDLMVHLVRPDGLEITPFNLPANVQFVTAPLDPVDGVAYEQMMLVVDDAQVGTWTVKLIGDETAQHPYLIDVIGSIPGPVVDDLSLTQTSNTQADLNWSVVTSVPTTTVNFYATTGPITTTQVMTDSTGVTETVVIDQFSGAPILLDAATTLDGTPNTVAVDFADWESGDYYIWIDANDNIGTPTRQYLPGKLSIVHPWQPTWTADITPTVGYRTITATWDTHPGNDVDGYKLLLSRDGNFVGQDEIAIDVGNVTTATASGLLPDVAYTLKVIGYDLATGLEAESETIVATAAGAPFEMAADPMAVLVNGGDSAEITLTLTTTLNPYPARAVLTVVDQPTGIALTLPTNVVTPTVAGVTASVNISTSVVLASGTYTATVRASAGGTVRDIAIPITVQQPGFALRGSANALTLTRGASTSMQIDATYHFGETDDVFVTLSNVPAGALAAFDTQTFGVGEHVTLTVTDTELLLDGTYTLTVSGNDGEQWRTLDIPLHVDKPTFALAGVNGVRKQAIHGMTVTYTVALSGNDWTDPVMVSIDPASVGTFLTPTIVTPTTRTPLTVPTTFDVVVDVISPTTPAGVYEIVLVAQSGGLTETLPLVLHVYDDVVESLPDLAISAEYPTSVVGGEVVSVVMTYTNAGLTPIDTRIITAGGNFISTLTYTTTTDMVRHNYLPQHCSYNPAGTSGYDGTWYCYSHGVVGDHQLDPGETVIINAQLKIDELAGSGDQAVVRQIAPLSGDFDLSNNTTTHTMTVAPQTVDTAVTALSFSPSYAPHAGTTITFTADVVVTNTSVTQAADARNVTVTFAPLDGLTVQNAPSGCVVMDDAVVCTIERLESNCFKSYPAGPVLCSGAPEPHTLMLATTIHATRTTPLTMTVTVETLDNDPNTGNNYAEEWVAVDPFPLVQWIDLHANYFHLEGSDALYGMTVENIGSSVLTNFYISQTLDAAAYYPYFAFNGVPQDHLNSFVYRFPTFEPGDMVTLTVPIRFGNDSDNSGWQTEYFYYSADQYVSGQWHNIWYQTSNVAPVVTITTPVIYEGDIATLSATSYDPGWLDPQIFNWDMDNNGAYDDVTGRAALFDASLLDGPTSRTVAVQVADDDTATVKSQQVSVLNAVPTVAAMAEKSAEINQPITINTTFHDPGVADTHTASINWGDGTIEPVAINNGAVAATHSYTQTGVYGAELCVTDDDGGVGCRMVELEASCIAHGLVLDKLVANRNGNGATATASLNYLGTLLPSPVPNDVAITLYADETAVDTITVENAFASGFSKIVQFDVAVLASGVQTITARLDDDGTRNPLQLCVSRAAEATLQSVDLTVTQLSAKEADKVEGDVGATQFTFEISRSHATEPATYNFVVTSDMATADDFQQAGRGNALPSGSVSLGSGIFTQTFSIDVAGDTTVEADETFTVTISLANELRGATLSESEATGTIRNDDASFSLVAKDADKAEGDSDSTPFIFEVTRTGSGQAATFDYVVTSDSADANDFLQPTRDTSLPSGSIDFATDEMTQTIIIDVRGDTTVEADETFTMTISLVDELRAETITTAEATGTIRNDDASFSIAAKDADKAEGDSDSTAFTFEVTRTGSGQAATFEYVVTSDSADADDFVTVLRDAGLPSGSIDFATDQMTETITIDVRGDTTVEADETFTVTISLPPRAETITTAEATGTIRNDDASFSIAAKDADKAEGDSDSTPFTFEVTRSGASQAATFDYVVTSDSADADDFVTVLRDTGLPSGSIDFATDELTKTIIIDVRGDTTVEADEAFTVTISLPSPRAETIETAEATGTIRNDDADPAPAVVSTDPVSEAVDVPVTTTITINFSEPVSVADPNEITLICDGSAQAFTHALSDSQTLVLTPTMSLPPGERCDVTVGATSVADADAFDPPNGLANDYTFSFTTAVADSPDSGQLQVSAFTYQADPTDNSPTGALDGFIVVQNIGTEPITLNGYKLGDEETRGGDEGMFRLPDIELAAGALLVIAEDADNWPYDGAADYSFAANSAGVPVLTAYTAWASGVVDLDDSEDEVILLGSKDEFVDGACYGTQGEECLLDTTAAGNVERAQTRILDDGRLPDSTTFAGYSRNDNTDTHQQADWMISETAVALNAQRAIAPSIWNLLLMLGILLLLTRIARRQVRQVSRRHT